MFLKPLLGLVFNFQKCSHTFGNWDYLLNRFGQLFKNNSMIQEYCRLRVSSLLRIAIPVEHVDEVVQLQSQDISPIPGVHPCLLGITNQRGSLLWVLHLEKFFGIQPMPLAKTMKAIALRLVMSDGEIRRLACVVMGLEEIITLDTQKLFPVPDKLPLRSKSLLLGLAKIEGNTYGIVNINEVFRILNPDAGISEEGSKLVGISTA
jgi:chemotaxis signal transduction protein